MNIDSFYIVLALLCVSIFFCLKLKKENKLLLAKQKKELSLRKSREVILGHTAEKIAPFLKVFPCDPQKCQFLGQPIDYICFEDEKIAFIEVKSGKAKLSAKQRSIKKLIQNKKVEWHEVRV